MVVGRDFVKQVAAQRVERVRNAIMRFVVERQIAQNVVVLAEKGFGIDAGALIFTLGKKLRDGKQAVGNPFHCGDDNHNVRVTSDRLNQRRGMQHALRAE